MESAFSLIDDDEVLKVYAEGDCALLYVCVLLLLPPVVLVVFAEEVEASV